MLNGVYPACVRVPACSISARSVKRYTLSFICLQRGRRVHVTVAMLKDKQAEQRSLTFSRHSSALSAISFYPALQTAPVLLLDEDLEAPSPWQFFVLSNLQS